MLEEHLAAVDREAQLAERCVVPARSKVLDDSAHVLQRDALAAHGGDDEQLDEVGKGVEPDSGPKIELALDGGDVDGDLRRKREPPGRARKQWKGSRRRETPAAARIVAG
jgi:hypothetical protein